MCQMNSKRIHSKSVKCYRIYDYWHSSKKLKSFYNGSELPEIGVPTAASGERNGKLDPFHAFRNKAQIKKWAKYVSPAEECVVFECTLSDKLEGGTWQQTGILTCTGNVLTIVRKIAKVHRANVEWL